MKSPIRGRLSALFKRAAISSALALTAGTLGLEAYGLHDDLSRTGGAPLTEGERAIAHSIFGDQIRTANIRKHFNEPNPPIAASVKVVSSRHIDFWGERNQAEDFSKVRGRRLGVFMHEMTHIWQHQNTFTLWQRFLRGCETYDYELTPDSKFADFCVEQQAAMVQHYVNRILYPPFSEPGIHDDAAKELARVVEEQFPQARITRLELEALNAQIHVKSTGYRVQFKAF